MCIKMQEKWSRQELWEGCLTIELPDPCIDCRTLRDLPQNQEVFLAGEGKNSFLVDMLELLEDEPTDERAARAHWKELADVNEAPLTKEEVFCVVNGISDSRTGHSRSATVVAGMQGEIRVWVALLRLHKEKTDLLLCWNQVDGLGKADVDVIVFKRIVASLVINNLDFLNEG